MRYSPLVALAMGNLAAAQFTNTSTSAIDTATGTETSDMATSTPSPVASVGNFNYLGCLASTNGFPSFALAYSSEDNSLEACAASCSTSNYFGTFTNDCYCGDDVEDSDTSTLGDDQCNIPCPADADQSCGGLIANNERLARRQSVAIGVLLSVFINVDIDGDDTTATVTNTISAEVTTTATSTFTEDGTTATTTLTTVVGLPTNIIINCYGNYCCPQTFCPACTKYQVVCRDNLCKPEVCHDDSYDMLKICHGDKCYYSDCKGDECDRKVVCHGNTCEYVKKHGDGKKDYVCHGDDCGFETCHGDACYVKKECEGEHCVVVPAKPEMPYSPVKPQGDKPVVPVHPTGDNKPVVPVHPTGDNKPVVPVHPTGDNKPVVPVKPTGDNNKPVSPEPTHVIVSGSGKMIPAVGLAAAVAGVAFLL